MATWWESPEDDLRCEWLKLLYARVRAAIGLPPSRVDLGHAQRDASWDR